MATYRVVVYGRRGDQDPYVYPSHDRVKASKVRRVVTEVAEDILAHEGRSDFGGWLVVYPFGAVVEVNGGFLRFVVRAWRN